MKSEKFEKTKQDSPIRPSDQYAGKPIYEIPFIPELFDKICPSSIIGKLKSVRQYPFKRMVDLLDIDYDRFRELGGGGSGKWVLFQDFSQKLNDPDMQDRILDIYHCCFVSHVYPEITDEETKDLTVSERFDLAVRQYILGVERITAYDSAVADSLTKLKALFCTRYTRIEIAEKLGISRERVRQLLLTIPKQMLEGTLPGAANLRISPSLMNEVKNLADTLPPVSSARTLCDVFKCRDFDNTELGNFLPLQRVPQRSVPVGTSDYRNFDQTYYVSAEMDTKWLKTYVNTLCGVLGNHTDIFEIRPIEMDGILSLMKQVEPEFQFDREVVQALLTQHQWFEELNMNGVVKYQMKYHCLQSAYKALARMVYEEKNVSLNEIDNIHRIRTNNPQAPSILNLVSVVKKRIPWIVSSGQNGKIEYSETGENRTRMIDVVRTWTKQRVLFTLDELTDHLAGLGYTDISGQTLRAYVSSICYIDNKRPDLFCHAEHVHEYTEGYSWRKKPRSGLMNWIAQKIHSYLMEMPGHTLSLKDVQDRLFDDTADIQTRHKFNYSIQLCLQRYLVKDGWVKVVGEELMLTERGYNARSHELERIGTRSRKPEFYDTVKNKAMSMLKASPEGEIPMTDLLSECRDMIGNHADTAIYKIVDGYMTDDVTTVKRGRRVFLKLIKQ